MPTSPNTVRVFLVQGLVPAVIAALACGVSLVLTVRFCVELRGDDSLFAAVVAGSIGVAFEMGKFCFGPRGAHLLCSGRPRLWTRGLALFILSGVLVVGSIGASMGYLLELDAAGRRATIAASSRYQELVRRSSRLDSQIALLEESAARDTRTGYRSRALETIAKMGELQTRREELGDRLADLESASAPKVEVGMLGALASEFGIARSRLRWVVYLAVAVALELIGLTALSLLPVGTVWRNRTDVAAADRRAAAEPVEYETDAATATTRSRPLVVAGDDVRRTQTNSETSLATRSSNTLDGKSELQRSCEPDPKYSDAVRVICERRARPSNRGVQHALQVGQRRAAALLQAMATDGLLRRVGRQYELRSATIRATAA